MRLNVWAAELLCVPFDLPGVAFWQAHLGNQNIVQNVFEFSRSLPKSDTRSERGESLFGLFKK